MLSWGKKQPKRILSCLLAIVLLLSLLPTTALADELPNTYAVSVDGGITHGSISAGAETAMENDTITVTVTPEAGYQLTADSLKYTTGAENYTSITQTNNDYTFTMPAASITVTAAFELQPTHTVTVSDPGTNGTISSSESETYQGNIVTLTVTPDTGYQLDSLSATDESTGTVVLSAGASANQYIFTMPGSDVTVTGVFEEIPAHGITVAEGIIGGTVVVSPTSAHTGDTVAITVTPDNGYVFGSLSVTDTGGTAVSTTAGENGVYTFVMPDSSATVTATFSKLYTITVVAEHGTITLPANSAAAGTAISFTNTPEAGYVLKSVTVAKADGTVTGSNTSHFVMPEADVTITAVFAVKYTVTAATPGNGTLAFTPTAFAGDEAYIKVAPNNGYEFESLTILDGSSASVTWRQGIDYFVNYYYFTMPSSNVTATATFKAKATYGIAAAGGIQNGSLTFSTENTYAGNTVTVTATPDSTYGLLPGSLKYTTDGINYYFITATSGVFGFTMPEGAVTVTAVFTLPQLTIQTAEELTAFSQAVNNGYTCAGWTVTLASDVTLGTAFQPIGYYDTVNSNEKPFSGTFDGGNHTVTLTMNLLGTDGQGLFGYVNGATIKNITVAGVVAAADSNNIAGLVARSGTTGVTIQNCTNNTVVTGKQNVAGILGSGKGSVTIIDCKNTQRITGGSNGVGGIVGGTSAALITIENCTNFGDITGQGNYVGGIAGSLAPVASSTNTIKNCGNEGNVSSGAMGCGGILGGSQGTASATGISIKGCYNTGNVKGANNTGGITGYLKLVTITAEDCYNTGIIAATAGTSTTGTGGILGYALAAKTNAAFSVTRCFNAGPVSGNSGTCVSALVGLIAGGNLIVTSSVNDSYFLVGTAGGTITLTGTKATLTDLSTGKILTELAGLAPALGSAYRAGALYPVLTWQTSGMNASLTTISGTAVSTILGADNIDTITDGVVAVELAVGISGMTEAAVTLPNALLTNLEEDHSGVDYLIIETDMGRVNLNAIALDELLAAVGSNDAVLTARRLASSSNAAAQDLIAGGVTVYEITATAGGSPVLTSSGSGTISLSLPYTRSDSSKAVKVYYIAGDGSKIDMKATYFASETRAAFSTSHLSLYSIEEETDTTGGNGGTGEGDVNASVWDGRSIDVSWFSPDANVYYIGTPAQLAGLAALVNGLYNEDIDTFAGNTGYIHANVASGDNNGPNGQNLSTGTYHYGDYDFNGKTICLTADLDMGGVYNAATGSGSGPNFMPIGGQYLMTENDSSTKLSSSFCGTFDGQGHTVYNIYCSRRCTTGNYGDGESVGLIGRLGVHDNDPTNLRPYNPTVRNVAVTGYIYANRSVGGIVGKIGKTSVNNDDGSIGGIIENCANFATIKNTDTKGCGGIVGAGWNGGIVRNCYNAGTVISTFTCPTAGISGSNEITLENCYNIGLISAKSSSYAMAIGTNNAGAPYATYVLNCWYLEGSAPGGGYYSSKKAYNDNMRTSAVMKSKAFLNAMGPAFAEDTYNTNNGYPVLSWQNTTAPTGTGDTSGLNNQASVSAIIEVKATTNGSTSTGKVDATDMTKAVSDAIANAAKDGTIPTLEIKVDAPATSTKVLAEIPKSSFVEVANSTVTNLTVTTPVGSVTLDAKALGSIAGQAKGTDVTLSVAKVENSTLTKEQKEAVGTGTVFDLSVASGGTAIHDFGSGKATVTIPYTLKSGDKADDIVIWYLDDSGKLTQIEGAVYNTASGTVTFTTTHFSLYVVDYDHLAAWKNPFTDVAKTAWYYESVWYAVTNGLFNGTTDTTFSPEVPMTRGMFVTVLGRLDGVKESDYTTSSFTDVKTGMYYSAFVEWAAKNDIVGGVGGMFDPDRAITREEMAAILYRYATHKKLDVSKADDLAAFTDATSVSDWAAAAFKWTVAEELINGIDGTLSPKSTATRAQVAMILMRFSEDVA